MACTHGDMTVELANALRDLARVTAELAACKEDAERYRHARANPAMLLHLKNSEFDAAIDAAIKEGL